jgi:hypothetical protein
VETPFEYVGGAETCIGCADIIRSGDTVAPISEDRPDRLLCVACWWLQASELPLPRWSRASSGRANLAGVFRARRDRPHPHRRRT